MQCLCLKEEKQHSVLVMGSFKESRFHRDCIDIRLKLNILSPIKLKGVRFVRRVWV